MTEAKAIFLEAGIPKDKAQGVVDLYTKAATAAQARAQAAFDTQQTEFLSTINAMPEFQGATRETSLTAISKVLDEYGPDAKTGILSNPLVGNDPAMVRFMLGVANALSEGTPASGGRPAPNGRDGRSNAGKSMGQTLFPDQPSS